LVNTNYQAFVPVYCRKNEPVEKSPVLTKTRPKRKAQQQSQRPAATSSSLEEDEDDVISQPRRLLRLSKMVIVDSSDDEDFEPGDSTTSFVVAEPSLEDLRNMGLVQGMDCPSSASTKSSQLIPAESSQKYPPAVSEGGSQLSQSSTASQSSVASNELDNYTESLAQVRYMIFNISSTGFILFTVYIAQM
jgi:hypothetical protein